MPTVTLPVVGTMKRDHVIFLGAMMLLSAGLADGLYRGFGLPVWAAAPVGVALWSSFAVLMVRQSRKELAVAEEDDDADEHGGDAQPAPRPADATPAGAGSTEAQ